MNAPRDAIRPPPAVTVADARLIPDPFALDHVLVSELPASLGTVDAPDRYVVTAIFTRRPDPLELKMLGTPEVRERLAAHGYTEVSLTAVDRRLLIGNTNLHELEAGLARHIGAILADIGTRVDARRGVGDEYRTEAAQREAERAGAVMHAAKRISFDSHESRYR